jgi:hypothetical protein
VYDCVPSVVAVDWPVTVTAGMVTSAAAASAAWACRATPAARLSRLMCNKRGRGRKAGWREEGKTVVDCIIFLEYFSRVFSYLVWQGAQ